MKKFIFSTILFLSTATLVSANPIDAQRAKQIARTTLLENVEDGARKTMSNTEMVIVAQDQLLSEPAYYICQPLNGEGFAIIAGDDCEDEILGYSTTGEFLAGSMPPALCDLLHDYALHIAQVRSGEAEANVPRKVNSSPNKATSVSALCKTSWAQAAPFYNLCPSNDTGIALAGCGATATSQVMYYYKYPASGTGTVSGTFNNQRTDNLNLEEITFNYEKMLLNYNNGYSDEEAQAVAELMRAIGYGCKMQYGINFSGSYISDAAYSLRNNFGYSNTTKTLYADSFEPSNWLNKIKAELEEGRPIIYAGYTTDNAGHIFICDGFNFKDLVHINWGWGGQSNGFFNITVLSPNKNQPEKGYVRGHEAVIGIQPMVEGEDRSVQYQINLREDMSFSANGSNFTVKLPTLYNSSGVRTAGSVYYVLFNDDEEIGNVRLISYNAAPLLGNREQDVNVSVPSDLADGSYTMRLAFKSNDSDKWYWVETGDRLSVINFNVEGGTVSSGELVVNGINPIINVSNVTPVRKYIDNGRIVITKNNQRYNIQGIEIK